MQWVSHLVSWTIAPPHTTHGCISPCCIFLIFFSSFLLMGAPSPFVCICAFGAKGTAIPEDISIYILIFLSFFLSLLFTSSSSFVFHTILVFAESPSPRPSHLVHEAQANLTAHGGMLRIKFNRRLILQE